MTSDELKDRLESLAEGTHVEITDLTGTGDHYQVVVVSDAFEGKTKLEQHRLVNQKLEEQMKSGEIHALALKTYTNQQYLNINESKISKGEDDER